jgi:hypothetical protein
LEREREAGLNLKQAYIREMSVADCNVYSSSHKGEKNFKGVYIKWY